MSSQLECALIGLGRSITRRGDERIKTVLQLQVEAAAAAMGEAGIGRADVGALFTGRMPRSYLALQFNQAVVNELKVAPKFTSEVTSHGAGALGTIQLAAMVVNTGVIDYALCMTGEASPVWIDVVEGSASWETDLQFEAPYGPTTPSLYAQFACRYMHESDVTSEQMARVAVENREWALRHPHAAMRDKGSITVGNVLESRMIASPLRLLDCAAWYPGGIGTAVVVTRPELAREREDAVFVRGFGQRTTHEWVAERMETWGVEPSQDGPNLVHTGARLAARDAYEMSGLTPSDIDIVETSAPFTFANLMMLEELGFCEPGQAGAFVEAGGIDFEGGLPFNTMGGYLSFGQSGQGLYALKGAVDQLLGQAEGEQVLGADLAMIHGHGGPLACHSVVIIGKEAPDAQG